MTNLDSLFNRKTESDNEIINEKSNSFRQLCLLNSPSQVSDEELWRQKSDLRKRNLSYFIFLLGFSSSGIFFFRFKGITLLFPIFIGHCIGRFASDLNCFSSKTNIKFKDASQSYYNFQKDVVHFNYLSYIEGNQVPNTVAKDYHITQRSNYI